MTTLKRYTGTAWETVAWPNNVGMSPQTLGYAEAPSGSLAVANGGDVPGLSVTVTVPEGRRIRVSSLCHLRSSVSTDTVYARIVEDGVLRQFAYMNELAASPNTVLVTGVLSPAAGTHTYKITGNRQTGSGNLTVYSGPPQEPSWLLVEDITGSTLPYQPASVPVGQLAQSSPGGALTAFTAETIIPGYAANVVVPAGRLLKITVTGDVYSNGTAAQAAILRLKDNGINFADHQITTVINPGTSQTYTFVAFHSPSAGAHLYTLSATRNSGADTLQHRMPGGMGLWVEDVTPTPASSSGAPGSTLAYVEKVANQTGISTETDLTDLSVTVTVPVGRRLRLSAQTQADATVATVEAILRIKEGATQLGLDVQITPPTIAGWVTLRTSTVVTPSAGTHTYKVSLQRGSGSGTISSQAAAAYPAFILVEDITGSLWPAGSTVTAGMVASEAWTVWTPTVTQGVAVTKTLNYARYTKVGRTVTAQAHMSVTSAGTAANAVEIGLPLAMVSIPAAMEIGTGIIYDQSAVLTYKGFVSSASTTTFQFRASGTSPGVLGTHDFTAALASGDQIAFTVTYEAAS